MTRFILHVGPHKTGTSYLQEAFVRTRGLLAERGICYPAFWGATAHYKLEETLRAGPSPLLEQQFAELRRAGWSAVLVSVEGLASLPPAGLARLRQLIGEDNEAVVVFYVRSWADRLPSHWKQNTKEGGTETLPEYLHERLARPFGSGIVNFRAVLRNCREAFGAAALVLVPYDLVLAEGGDLFAHFAATFLDWHDPPPLALPRANVSPGPGDTEVIRAINRLETIRLGRAPAPHEVTGIARRYLWGGSKLAPPVLREALLANIATAAVDETSAGLAELHRQLHAEFGAALVEPRLEGQFFVPRRAEVRYVQRDYLLAPGVAEALHELHRTLHAPPA